MAQDREESFKPNFFVGDPMGAGGHILEILQKAGYGTATDEELTTLRVYAEYKGENYRAKIRHGHYLNQDMTALMDSAKLDINELFTGRRSAARQFSDSLFIQEIKKQRPVKTVNSDPITHPVPLDTLLECAAGVVNSHLSGKIDRYDDRGHKQILEYEFLSVPVLTELLKYTDPENYPTIIAHRNFNPSEAVQHAVDIPDLPKFIEAVEKYNQREMSLLSKALDTAINGKTTDNFQKFINACNTEKRENFLSLSGGQQLDLHG